mgnify:CR=1 FL=1|jgi:hypothetical protein|tara:strand:- start:70 stop:216 length:147 start_codon:yes stop_codon:yes gene_type:complete
MYPLPPINVPAPVASDFLLTQEDMEDMLSDEESIELFAALYFPNIVWN